MLFDYWSLAAQRSLRSLSVPGHISFTSPRVRCTCKPERINTIYVATAAEKEYLVVQRLAAQALADTVQGRTTVVRCVIGRKGGEGLVWHFVDMMTSSALSCSPARATTRYVAHVARRGDSRLLRRRNRCQRIFLNATEPCRAPCAQDRCPFFHEQAVVAETSARLWIDESLKISWRPQFFNARIARDLARHILRT